MKNITLHNYEEFALDYKDGLLSGELQKEFESFLNDHFELKEELDAFMNIKITDEHHVVYPDKKALYKKGALNKLVIGMVLFFLIAIPVMFLINNQSENNLPDFANDKKGSHLQKDLNSSKEKTLDRSMDSKSLKGDDLEQSKNINKSKLVSTDHEMNEEKMNQNDQPSMEISSDQRVTKTFKKNTPLIEIKKAVRSVQKDDQPSLKNESLKEEKDVDSKLYAQHNPQHNPQLHPESKTELISLPEMKFDRTSTPSEIVMNEFVDANSLAKREDIVLASLSGVKHQPESLNKRNTKEIDQLQMIILEPQLNNVKKGMFGNFAFSNVTISLLPSYLKTKK